MSYKGVGGEKRVKSKNPTGATGRKCVWAVIRDTRLWIRGYQTGEQSNQSQGKNAEVPGCVQTGTSSLIWLQAAVGAKRQDYQILGPWQKLKTFSYILFAIYKATISTWLLRILNKGGEERPSIWSPWTGSLRTQSSLNYNSKWISDGLSVKTHFGFPGHHRCLPVEGLQKELIWP